MSPDGPADGAGGIGRAPWAHPGWHDPRDTTGTVGPAREPEPCRGLVLALGPLDTTDHLVDVGTGKPAGLIARGDPRLGRVTLDGRCER